MKKITVSGTGCALIDEIYNNVRFSEPSFQRYLSKTKSDGGLYPGRLVFTDELEKYTDCNIREVIAEITYGQAPAFMNLGGPGLISLINVSQILPEDDYLVRFFGCVGADEYAGEMTKKIKQTPLGYNLFQINNEQTPLTFVLTDPIFNDSGERSFIHQMGAAKVFCPDNLIAEFFDSDIVCFGGTALVPHIHDSLHDLLKHAKSRACFTVVNTVYDFRNERDTPYKKWPLGDTPDSLKYIDLLIMNKEEALKISGMDSLIGTIDYFIANDSPCFVITQGSSNIMAYSDGRIFKQKGLFEFPVSERVTFMIKSVYAAKIDTTGCGDNFAGGMIAAVATHMKDNPTKKIDLENAISWGVVSGGFACFYLGDAILKRKGERKKDCYQIFLKITGRKLCIEGRREPS